MITRATRSPRRRTVVALAVVLAVLAGFIVRLVDIQVVNADEHIARVAWSIALGGSQTLYGTRGDDRRRDRPDARRQRPGVRLPARPAADHVRSIRTIDDGEVDVASRGRRSPPRSRELTGQTVEEVQTIVADALADDPESRFAMPQARALDRAVPRPRRPRRAVPRLRAASRPHLPGRRGRRQPRRLHGHRRRSARGLEMSRGLCLAGHERHPRLPEGQGRRRHPRHRARAAGDRRRHAASSRSTATCSGTCSS